MKIKKILIIITLILLLFCLCYACFIININNKNLITKDFEITSYIEIKNKVKYGVDITEEESGHVSFNASDYHLPSNLYDYRDDVRLRISYSPENYKIYDCKVVNFMTNEIIKNISKKNIEKLFNIEYERNINEKDWTDIIKLSELKQNEIYKYTANSKTQFPEIKNDIGENCIIYLKGKDEDSYEKKINMFKNCSGGALSFSLNEYNSGESFNFMYRKIENSELLRRVSQDDIIFLSKFKDGDKLEYELENYIYNDTETDINVDIKNVIFGMEYTDSILIEKGKIYGFDWMINSAIIRYSNDNDINDDIDIDRDEMINDQKENIIMSYNNNNEIMGLQDENTIINTDITTNNNYNSISIVCITLGFILITIAIILVVKSYKFKNTN